MKLFPLVLSKLFIIAIIAIFFLPASSYAAGTQIIFESEKSVVSGREFVVKVLLDTGDTPLNALSGTVHLQGDATITEIRDGNSIIPLWIERPTIASTSKDISFAGIVPGSFGGKGELIQFVVVAPEGLVTISLHEVQALAPGPEPISVNVESSPLTISIIEDENATTTSVLLEDSIPPEPFSISIETDPNLFDGAPFAVFATQDKQSGIAGYEAAFSFFTAPNEGEWQTVTSPYQIPEEGKGKQLYIRALDRKGNATVTHIAAPGYYRNMTILAILTVTILCLLFFVARRRGRSGRSS